MRLTKHSNPEAEVRNRRQQARLVIPLLGWLLLSSCLAGCGRGPRAGGAQPAGSGMPAAAGAKAVEIQEDPVKTGIESTDALLAGKVRAGLAADPRLRQLAIEIDA